ncbi:Plasmodium exported protein (Pm-fam-a like), unknown function [Plasmodium malariae]|uniref:Fam-m protein n=1 Tax=Plasmodium malariae TaxID=5858 RepID=A0A1A8X4C5_PLAMA|nr:Plasmodium exported protein (Pm-fam-a like), unknown function [Plasmodium malariae]
MYSKSIDTVCNIGKILYRKNYRLLAKYKQINDSNNVCLNKIIPISDVDEKKEIYNNVKEPKERNNKSSRKLLNKAEYYTEVIDYNNGMFDGKHFHFEKKLIKKKDYDNFLEKNRRISDIALKKIKFRNKGFGVAIIFIFFLLGIGIPSLYGIESLKIETKDIHNHEIWKHFTDLIKIMVPESIAPYVHTILFSILIVIISIILIVTIYKILRNNEKYERIKLIYQ